MGKKKRSRRHHYLPRHYLRGFTDEAGSFSVYDKRTGRVFRISPDAAFFENDLNTVTFSNGNPSDFLERLYAEMEGEAWDSLGRIRSSTPDAPIDIVDKMDLFLFLSFLHWRLPSNAAAAEQLSQRFFGSDRQLRFFNIKSTTGDTVPQYVIDRIRTSPWWAKAARTVVPFMPFFTDGWSGDLAHWRFLYPADGNNWWVVGDNPIVTCGGNDHDPATCLKEFVFPVSGKVLLISRGERLDRMLPPEFAIQYGIAIIERAHRFVACQDRSFLAALVRHHALYVRFDKTDRIIAELFGMLGGTQMEGT